MSGNRKLGKRTDQRKAMLRAMVTYLLENGQIKTTLARAKEVAPLTEKMIWPLTVRLWRSSPRRTWHTSCSPR